MPNRMQRLEKIVGELPEAERVDIAEWGDHPTFRVRGKNFVFTDQDAGHLTVKLPKEEAAAVVATDDDAEPASYGLGRHGWVAVTVPSRVSAARWAEITRMGAHVVHAGRAEEAGEARRRRGWSRRQLTDDAGTDRVGATA